MAKPNQTSGAYGVPYIDGIVRSTLDGIIIRSYLCS